MFFVDLVVPAATLVTKTSYNCMKEQSNAPNQSLTPEAPIDYLTSSLPKTTRRRFLKKTGTGLGVALGTIALPQGARATGTTYYYYVVIDAVA